MEFTRKDLCDIVHISGISDARWIELLTKSLDVINEANEKASLARMWPLAGELLWNSVLRANRKCGVLRCWVSYLPEDDKAELEQWFSSLKAVIPLIRQLEKRLPEEVSKFDQVLTYCGIHSRSWLHVAMKDLEKIAFVANRDSPLQAAAKLFSVDQYDSDFVSENIEVEKKRFNAMLITPPGREPVSVEEYIVFLLDDTTESVAEQTNKQTTEQTVSDNKQTEVGQKVSVEKKPWTDLATDLKKRWFAEMRKRQTWIPRKAFLIDFFASSDGQRDKWKGLNHNTEDRRFQDNPSEWKDESEDLKSRLKNRR